MLVIHSDYLEDYLYLKEKYKLVNIIIGGTTRFLSLKLALNYYKDFSNEKNVIVCESARPFYDLTVIEELYKNLANFDCVVPISKQVNTSVYLDDENTILDRENLYEMNTPIIYNFNKLCQYVEKSSIENVPKLVPKTVILMAARRALQLSRVGSATIPPFLTQRRTHTREFGLPY